MLTQINTSSHKDYSIARAYGNLGSTRESKFDSFRLVTCEYSLIMSSTKTIATCLTHYLLLASNESGQNMIDSNFWKLCCSIEVLRLNRVVDRNYRQCGSNEICRTLELKTDSNVELERHVRKQICPSLKSIQVAVSSLQVYLHSIVHT